jgi:TolA-binding protein
MTETRTTANPFPGLRPFETEEYRLFFGREGQSDALIERLQRSRFLAVVGTSGSGKSSLVRAGLLPALRGGMMAGAGAGWRIAVMRPGHDPLGNLARVLTEDGVLAEAGGGLPRAEAEAVVEATLRRGSLGLVEAARRARLSEREKLLVVVDQFEELFRFRSARAAASTGDDASAFVKLLLEAAQQRELSIYVVLTMRSDFLGDCAQFQGLPEAINDGQYLIPRQTRDERRVAIVGPVRVSRARMSEPLVSRLLNDVGDNPDQLPILQHALMRTWDYWSAHRRDGEPLGLADYEAIGTMSDALSRHADEAWGELTDERSRRTAEILFKALTERGADNREIRRPTRLEEICEIAGASEAEVVAVVAVFRREGRSFLMPPAGVALDADTVIDISHESLIRNWERLKAWVAEEAQSARIYRRLAEAAVLHRDGEEGLLQDPGLQIALDWREKNNPNAAWGRRYHPEFDAAIAYLEESRAARDAAAAEGERRRQEELDRERREREQAEAFAESQRRAAQRLRRFTFALVVISLFALSAAFASAYAFTQARQSERQAHASEAQAKASEERAQKLAGDLQDSLKEVTAAKEDANRQRDAALTAQRAAEAEKTRAQDAEKKEEEARLDAQEKAKLAEEEKLKAQAEERRAEAEARQNRKAKVANDMFREGVALTQRGDYDEAEKLFADAIGGYRDVDVSNDEAVADSKAQLGNMFFAVGYSDFLAGDTDLKNLYGPAKQVNQLRQSYDEAAAIYAGPKVNSPEKAAATLFTLGTMLLKFTKDADDEGVTRAAGPTAPSDTEGRVPYLGIRPKFSVGTAHASSADDENPKDSFKQQAVERFRRAFDFYRLTFGDKRGRGDEAGAKAALEGMRKATYQAGNFLFKESNAMRSSADDAAKANDYRRQAAQHFEQLLSLSEGDDVDVARLLVWLGGLYYELGDGAKADSYFERAISAFQKLSRKYDRPDALDAVIHISERAGQKVVAAHLGEQMLKELERLSARNRLYLPMEASTLAFLGRVHEGESDPGSFEKAVGYYRRAVETYARAYGQDKSATELSSRPADLLHIGSVAKGINDTRLALDAFNLAAALAGGSRFGDHKREEAAAYSEMGSVYLLVGDAVKALDAYEKSARLYGEIAGAESSGHGNEDAKAELERIEKVITALKAAPPPSKK